MKKFIAIALFAIFTTACTPTENAGMMDKGMMCEKCPCCQKMMESGMKMDGMKDGMMKSGMQCPMMQGKSKDGMKCGCCQGMIKDGKMQCPMMKGGAKNGMKCECCQKMMKDGMAKKQGAVPDNAFMCYGTACARVD